MSDETDETPNEESDAIPSGDPDEAPSEERKIPSGERGAPSDGPEGPEIPSETTTEPMSDTDSTPTAEQSTGRNVERYVRYVVLAGFTLLALVALLRFYFAASATIDTWVSTEYRSMFQAAFNLVVLLLAGIGISWQVRSLA